MVRRIRTLLPAIWLMFCLLLPVTAYLLGVRQPLLENRTKTEFPRITPTTLRQDETFRELDAAIRERLPLRGEAITARGKIAMRIFGDSASREVIFGKEDWLYYRPELLICEPAGRPDVPPEDVIEVLIRTIAASGRKAVVTIAGSKIVTHQEHLKEITESERNCLEDAESPVQARLVNTPGGHSIQPELERIEQAGHPTFLRSDTHWNARGRKVFLDAILDGIRPGLAAKVKLEPQGVIDRSGDLGPFIGQKRIDHDRQLTVTGKTRGLLPPGEVLLTGDSQLWNSVLTPGADGKTVLETVFARQVTCDQYEMQDNGCVKQMLRAKTIVLESVARNYQLLEDVCWRPVAALSASVRGHRARWPGGARSLPLTPDPHSTVVNFPNDRSDVMRLLRIPVRSSGSNQLRELGHMEMVKATPEGSPRPCASTSVPNGVSDEIIIPVAAGEYVADVRLQVSGPSAVELGTPDVLYLDGRPLPQRPAEND